MIYRLSLMVSLVIIFSTATAQVGKILSEEDYRRAAKFLGTNTNALADRSSVNAVWLADGRFWYGIQENGKTSYVLVNAKDGKKQQASSLKELGLDAPSPRISRGSALEISSPDGKKSVYIKNWNLWMKDKQTGKETQLTTDGVENFGYATDNAGWRHSDRPVVLWSPDSKKIASYQQDQRHTKDMYLVSTNVGAPNLQQWRYPLPEDSMPIMIHRVIIDVDNGKTIRLEVAADPRRASLCDDIVCSGSFDDNQWSEDSKELAFVSTSRDHRQAKLRIADAVSGKVREVFEETVATQFESGREEITWRYLPASKEVIWYSQRDDWGHLYLYDAVTGKLKNQITSGNFVVSRVLHIDEKSRKILFSANGRQAGQDPYFRHLYSIDMNGRNIKLLSPEEGNHNITLSPDRKYFVDSYSQPHIPPVTVLRDINGKLIAELEKADISRLSATGWKAPTPIQVKSRDGRWDLYGLMFTPTNLDSSKKYPVVNYIYPGPQGGTVGSRNFSTARGDHQALAELGFIVVLIDGTCNPYRSKSFHDACYGDMADNTLDDQIGGMRQLQERYGFLDLDRVGIWGHSGGGFATAAALFRYADFYKVGVSQAGNHDNRNYEDDWGERYIGLVNGDNYKQQANQEYAKNLKGHLLIAHGAMDDNVPPYNTYLVVDALIKANKDFDLIIFPHARHGFGADNQYMMRRRWDYFVKHLMGAEPPKNFNFSAN